MKSLLLSLALLAGLNTNAYAEPVCFKNMKPDELAKAMKMKPLFLGDYPKQKTRYAVFIGQETGVWNAFVMLPDGRSCLLVEGMGFSVAEPKKR